METDICYKCKEQDEYSVGIDVPWSIPWPWTRKTSSKKPQNLDTKRNLHVYSNHCLLYNENCIKTWIDFLVLCSIVLSGESWSTMITFFHVQTIETLIWVILVTDEMCIILYVTSFVRSQFEGLVSTWFWQFTHVDTDIYFL